MERELRRYGLSLVGETSPNYYLYIEDAIETCEIAACKGSNTTAPVPDKADQLKKMKDLLDQGAITQEEYDIEKKKILSQ